jgi:phage-related protein
MAFYAKNFIFNDIPSEFYNLYLGTFNGEGENITTGSDNVNLLTQKLYRRPVPLFWGAEQTPVLTFPLSVYSTSEITAQGYSEIASWLFGQQNYKVLRICQNDMVDVYFNCFLTEPEIVREGNIIRGFTATVVCDSPWGWKEPKSYVYTCNVNYYTTGYIKFLNESANSFYTYPTEVKITANLFGGTVTITNTSDASRQSILTVLPNEVITINSDLQTISSDLITYPLYNFNLNFPRFIRGVNNLVVTGNLYKLEITSPVAVKISG